MVKLNLRVLEVLERIKTLEPSKNLTLTKHGSSFQLFYKGEQIAGDLTLTDLRTISQQATRLKIVQLVDVSHLVFTGHIKSTDAYLKIEDDIAMAFLHVIKKMKFQDPATVPEPAKVVT